MRLPGYVLLKGVELYIKKWATVCMYANDLKGSALLSNSGGHGKPTAGSTNCRLHSRTQAQTVYNQRVTCAREALSDQRWGAPGSQAGCLVRSCKASKQREPDP